MSTIYALCASDTGEIRYVGKTVWPVRRRLLAHLAEARLGRERSHRCNWLCSLPDPPTIRPLIVVPDVFASEMECRTIRQLRQKGYRLVNGTDGGEGAVGLKMSDEAKARISAANTGKKRTEEVRKKLSAMRLGKKLKVTELRFRKRPRSPQWQANLTAALPRQPLSAEHKAKIRASMLERYRSLGGSTLRGRKLSPEHCSNVSAALRGKAFTPEHRARAVAGIRARIAERKAS